MTVAISNGIVVLLLFLRNTYAQQGVNSNVVNNGATSNTAGANFNPVQPGQQTNWQQLPNMQLSPASLKPQNSQQPGVTSQVKQQIPLSDIFSVLQNLRFSPQKLQANPTQSCGYKQTYDQTPSQLQSQQSLASNNQQTTQYTNQVPESPKPSFTFQFVPVSSQNVAPENQMQTAIPIQFLTNGQSSIASQAGSSYYMQNQPTNSMTSQQVSTAQTSTSQPIVFTVNSQQPTGQSQPIVYTMQSMQPSSRSSNQQKTRQPMQSNMATENPMALLMSQLQTPSANPDLSSILPMIMNSKPEKSGSMKALLPLILNLLTDKGCGCPHCGCPYNNAEPTINSGYSNQINYSQQGLTDNFAKVPEISKSFAKNIDKTNNEVVLSPKQYKKNVISEISEETSEEDEEYEYDDD